MKSVADGLREQTHDAVRKLPTAARIALALSLGDDDLDLFERTSGLSRAEARDRLRAPKRARAKAQRVGRRRAAWRGVTNVIG